VVFAISLYGASRQNFQLNQVSLFESIMIEAFAPIQRSTLSLKEKITYFFDHYVMIVNTSKKNEELVKKVDQLENTIFELREVEKENQRLKEIFDFAEDIQRKKILAQVVGWDASNEFKVLRINKGRNSGLKLLSPVITMNGLVGYVYRLSNNYADILTILDQNNRVDAIVESTRSHGVVEGISQFKCRLKYVIRTEVVKEGDGVLTAGLGDIYPKGIKIGTITSIDKENFGITQSIEVTPAVDFNRLEEVVVLIQDEATTKKFQDEGKIDEI
jgi:rod shape-determining protein MreC